MIFSQINDLNQNGCSYFQKQSALDKQLNSKDDEMESPEKEIASISELYFDTYNATQITKQEIYDCRDKLDKVKISIGQ